MRTNEPVLLHGRLLADNTTLHGRLNAIVRAGRIDPDELPIGHALMWDDHGRLAVEVATEANADNTLPITSAAVQTAIGNIDVLLQTI